MKRASPVRTGLAGCGGIAQAVHLGVLQRRPEFDLVAVADPDEQSLARAAARAPKAAGCRSLDELLEQPDLDAVVVCLPSDQHAGAAHAVLASGRHLYLEKPLASNYGDAKRLVDRWGQTELVVMLGFNYRFHPLYEQLQTAITANQLGELREGQTRFTSARGPLPEWKKSRASGGGVLLDLGSHHLDLLRMLLGRHPLRVECRLRSEHSEEDTAAVTLHYENELVITSTFDLYSGNEDWVELAGQAKQARVDRLSGLRVSDGAAPATGLSRVADIITSPYARKKWRHPTWEASYEIALAHFASAVRGAIFTGPSLVDGLENLALLQACETSARLGGAVAVTAGAREQ